MTDDFSPLLTKLHADVLVRILLPQLIVALSVAHEGENHILDYALENKKLIKEMLPTHCCAVASSILLS